MKLTITFLLLASLASAMAGCDQNISTSSSPAATASQSPEDQIRTAIEARLAHSGTLDVKAFNMDITKVTIDGDHAMAQVDFRVKSGPGSMQMTYALEKQNGSWSVINTNPVGSNFSHPPLDGQAPAVEPAGVGHSVSDILNSFKAGSAAAPSQPMPPGHPPVNASPYPSN